MGNNINKVIVNNYLNSLKSKKVSPLSANKGEINKRNNDLNKSFKTVLEEKIYNLKFSKHAVEQIDKREINISVEEYSKIRNGFIKSKEKGSRESLFIINGKGFLVSVKNNVIITCFKKEDLKENIITNIDSVYIV